MEFVLPEQKRVALRNIIGTALEDKSYKERLIENPEAGIRELYPDFKAGPNIKMVDQTDDIENQYFNISRGTYLLLGGNIEDLEIELDDAALDLVAGGAVSCPVFTCNSRSSVSGSSGLS